MQISNIMAIDFEASGLAPDSWPIEIGLAWLDLSSPSVPRVKAWSSLIRPEPDWCESLWDPVSEETHSISLQKLKAEGCPAWDVARHAWERLEGRTLVSDAPSFDTRWLSKLLDVNPRVTPFEIQDFDGIAAALLGEIGLVEAWMCLEGIPMPHRAGEDAASLIEALVGAKRDKS